jgi:hypothetical protein
MENFKGEGRVEPKEFGNPCYDMYTDYQILIISVQCLKTQTFSQYFMFMMIFISVFIRLEHAPPYFIF